jgi:hypothetical protein
MGRSAAEVHQHAKWNIHRVKEDVNGAWNSILNRVFDPVDGALQWI